MLERIATGIESRLGALCTPFVDRVRVLEMLKGMTTLESGTADAASGSNIGLLWRPQPKAPPFGRGWFTEAGFIRIVSNPAFSRDAVQPREAIQVLSANTAAKDHEFWPDEVPVAGAVAFAGVRLMGHQQVTDAYLLGLAISRGGALATLDKRIGALIEPKSAERKALEIVV